MKIEIINIGRDQKVRLLDDNDNELFEQYDTYDELSSAGVEAVGNIASRFGGALGIPVVNKEEY